MHRISIARVAAFTLVSGLLVSGAVDGQDLLTKTLRRDSTSARTRPDANVHGQHGATFSVLYTFTGTDGAEPQATLLRKGNYLYGTTELGGNLSAGTVFKLDQNGNETVLYSFGDGYDGIFPVGGLIRDSAGNLYGTTTGDGGGYGVVFKLSHHGDESTLWSFAGPPDGASPYGTLLADQKGNLYGTTSSGGTGTGCPVGNGSCGTVFELSSTGTESVLYSFLGGTDGAAPGAGLIRDKAGNLYGTTVRGGGGYGYCRIYRYGVGCGTVFKVNSKGEETVLHAFTGGADGAFPSGVLVRNAGTLYGTTGAGGGSYGTVFELSRDGVKTVLYSFTGGADGDDPSNGVIRDSAGNLYGTTAYGGDSACIISGNIGCGTVFTLNSKGVETVLYSFTGGTDGALPFGGLIRDSAGNLYGTTIEAGNLASCGGAGCGTVFKLTP